MAAEITVPKQRGRPFQPGESGNPNGRPKGARQKLTALLLNAIAEDFAAHGMDAIAAVRKRDPACYLKIVSNLVPRDLVLQREREPDYANISDDELTELVQLQRRRRFIKVALENS